MNKKDNSKLGLLLLRTPFQAWLVQKVLAAEALGNYDILYFTHNNSEEDRFYFEKLATDARRSHYCWAPVRRFDILGHIDFYRQSPSWSLTTSYKKVMLASINSPVLNAMATHHKESELITFDDGLANIVPDGIYTADVKSWRMQLYRRAFGSAALNVIKQRIQHHYSVYPGFDNIVEAAKVRHLEGWCRAFSDEQTKDKSAIYFVGQPLEEIMTREQIQLVQERLRNMNINFYVKHPRERQMLDIGAIPIEKHGRIAEDAILQHANGRNVHLISWFSTTLFNLAKTVERCTMLLIKSSQDTEQKRSMAEKAGCHVEYI